MECEIDTLFPRVYLEGVYKGEGRIDALKFNSKGNFNFTFSKSCLYTIYCREYIFTYVSVKTAGLSTTQKMIGHFVNRDGHKYLELTGFDVSIFMKDFQFYATGLFPDEELSKLDRCAH